MVTAASAKTLLQGPQDSEQELEILAYYRVLMRYKWSILASALVFALIAVAIILRATPIFESSVVLLIEQEDSNVVSIEDVYSIGGAAEYLKTQFAILNSKAIAETVIERQDLTRFSEFRMRDWNWLEEWLPASLAGKIQSRNELLSEKDQLLVNATHLFAQKLIIKPVPNTQLVHIVFQSEDPSRAAAIADEVANVYIEQQIEARLQMTAKASGFLSDRVEALRAKLDGSEKALQDFRDRENLIDDGGINSLVSRKIQRIDAEVASAQRILAQATAARQQIQAARGQGYQALLSIPAVLEDRLLVELRSNEAEAERLVESLEKRYGPKHPRMIAARSDLETARQGIQKRVNDVVQGIESDYREAASSAGQLKSTLAATEDEMRTVNRKTATLNQLQQEVNANRQLYELFLNRYKETQESRGIERANARVIDPAKPDTVPVKPQKIQILVLALLLGMLVGVVRAFIVERLNNTFKDAMLIEEKLGLPILGALPLHKAAKADRNRAQYAVDEKSVFSESVRTLRTGILLSSLDLPDKLHKILLVTSSMPDEGKTTVTLNLAYSLSELHRVLLIDADMRKPSLWRYFGIEKNAKGLSDLLTGSAHMRDCFYKQRSNNLFVLPSGTIPPNPSELLFSKAFALLLRRLATRFDQIVIDSPPTLPVSDSRVLANISDAVVFVIKGDETPVPVARDAVRRLRESKANIIGGMLNMVDTRKKKKEGEYQGYAYSGGYYTEGYG